MLCHIHPVLLPPERISLLRICSSIRSGKYYDSRSQVLSVLLGDLVRKAIAKHLSEKSEIVK
jgi:hypothetical protein